MNFFRSFSRTLLIAGLFAAFSIIGCDKDNGTEPDTSIPDDIFPLTAGRYIEYTGYLTQNDTEIKIDASEPGYYTKWTIGSETPINAIFPNPPFNVSGTGVLVYDTTKVPALGVTSRFTPVFVKFDAATAEYSYLTNLGFFYRTFQITNSGDANIKSDSLRYIFLAKPRAGKGGTFTCFDETFTGTVSGATAPINLKIDGTWGTTTEMVTGGGASYEAYYLEIRRVITVGGTPVATGLTAKLWVAKGIGPVKMHLVGDAESHGNYRVISAKNF